MVSSFLEERRYGGQRIREKRKKDPYKIREERRIGHPLIEGSGTATTKSSSRLKRIVSILGNRIIKGVSLLQRKIRKCGVDLITTSERMEWDYLLMHRS
ncbi:hypothetical protein Tco_1417259 [Tanacetum coccineum]